MPSLAREGGLQSTLWAGPEQPSRRVHAGELPLEGTTRKRVVSLRLGFAGDTFSYAIDLGLPTPTSLGVRARPRDQAGGDLDRPDVPAGHRADRPPGRSRPGTHRRRRVRRDPAGPAGLRHDAHALRRPACAHRKRCCCASRCAAGGSTTTCARIAMLRHVVRNSARTRRCSATTAPTSPRRCRRSRRSATATPCTPRSTMRSLARGVEVARTDGTFEVTLRQPGLLRPLRAAELSDGTLRYLLLAAALLTPRPPELLVLNEPETSLHPGSAAGTRPPDHGGGGLVAGHRGVARAPPHRRPRVGAGVPPRRAGTTARRDGRLPTSRGRTSQRGDGRGDDAMPANAGHAANAGMPDGPAASHFDESALAAFGIQAFGITICPCRNPRPGSAGCCP